MWKTFWSTLLVGSRWFTFLKTKCLSDSWWTNYWNGLRSNKKPQTAVKFNASQTWATFNQRRRKDSVVVVHSNPLFSSITRRNPAQLQDDILWEKRKELQQWIEKNCHKKMEKYFFTKRIIKKLRKIVWTLFSLLLDILLIKLSAGWQENKIINSFTSRTFNQTFSFRSFVCFPSINPNCFHWQYSHIFNVVCWVFLQVGNRYLTLRRYSLPEIKHH